MPTHPGKPPELDALEAFASSAGPAPGDGVMCTVCGTVIDPMSGEPVGAPAGGPAAPAPGPGPAPGPPLPGM